jgi:hypothetical protein
MSTTTGGQTAMNYELTNSYVMRENVLNAGLRNAVTAPLNFFRGYNMVSAPAGAATSDVATAMAQHFALEDASALPPTRFAITAIIRGVRTSPTDFTLGSIIQVFRDIAMSMVSSVINATYSSASTQDSNIVRIAMQEMQELTKYIESNIPIRRDNFDSTPVSLQDHMSAIVALQQDYMADTSKVPSDLNWLYNADLNSIYASCMMQYFTVLYIASLIPGKWNATGDLAGLSFYDSRYAELALYRLAISFFSLVAGGFDGQYSALFAESLTAAVAAVPGSTAASLRDTIVSARDKYKEALSNKQTVNELGMLDGHKLVAVLSNGTKVAASQLTANNNDFEFRKSTLGSLLSTIHSDQARYEKQKRIFYAWSAAYIVIVLIGIALIATQRNNVFLLLSILILLMVTIYTLTRLIIKMVRGLAG